jgi:hypothetical protein
MASAGGGAGRRRRRRSSAEVARLEELRRAHAVQQEKARDDARRVESALPLFAEAAAGVESARETLESQHVKVERRLRRRLQELDQARAAAVTESESSREAAHDAMVVEVQRWRAVMGESVRAIRGAGVDVSETAVLLGITPREVGAMANLAPPVPADAGTSPVSPEPESGEHDDATAADAVAEPGPVTGTDQHAEQPQDGASGQ